MKRPFFFPLFLIRFLAPQIETRFPPGLLAPTLVTLPSMSRVPDAPFWLQCWTPRSRIFSELDASLASPFGVGRLQCS